MMNKRYMVVMLGPSKGISDDLDTVADAETGISYVDGTGIFIGTFYSPYTTSKIHSILSHRPAFMVFDITDKDNYDVNLPSKYYEGLFPEVGGVTPKILREDYMGESPINDKVDVDSLTDLDEIITKLEQNDFNRDSLTKKELDILDNC